MTETPPPATCDAPAWDEAARLAALHRYAILDTGRERGFDDVAELAADILDAPIAVVNFIAADRQWFKAEKGIGQDSLPLDVSICRYALLQPGVFVAPDLTKDDRFARNPLVEAADGLRFYAGALLETPEGLPLGTVCVLDTVPRPDGITPRQERALTALAAQTMAQLELRRAHAAAREEGERLSAMFSQATVGISEIGLDGRFLVVNDRLCEILGRPREELLTLGFFDVTHPDDLPENLPRFQRLVETGEGFSLDKRYLRPDGTVAWANSSVSRLLDGQGRPRAALAVTTDITARVEAERRQAFLLKLADRTRHLVDPTAIAAANARALGEELCAARVAYVDIDEARGLAFALNGWTDGTLAGLPGEMGLGDFEGPILDHLRAGTTFRVADIASDPRTGDAVDVLEPLRAHAIVSVPLLKGGRLFGNFNVHQTAPRAWTDGEVELIEAVADRTWEAVERARAEAKLRESERELQTLTDTLPVLVSYIDREERYRFVNKRYEEWFDDDAERIRGLTVREVVGDAAYQDLKPNIDRALAGERFAVERMVPYRSGGPRHVRVEYVPRYDEADRVQGYYALIQDVTERRAAQVALQELNETLERQVEERTAERDRMWETSPDLMVVIDFEGVFRRVNPAWTALLGYAPEELVGHHVNEFVLPDDHAATVDAYQTAAVGGRPRIENRYRHKDGSVRWVSWVAAPEGELTYATGRDVTAEKARAAELAATEAARREADALYRAYFENTAEALFVVEVLDDGGFAVEDLNPAHQAGVGLPLAEVAGKRIDEILEPELAEAVVAYYRQAVEAGAVIQYRERFDFGGKTTHWDTVLVPVRDHAGRVVRLIGSSRDLTGQVAAEEQLRQSQKMEAMGQLTGGVAHDFNNLLTPIIGSLDMLTRRGLGNEREQRLIDGAMQSAERAKTLVQRLLAFARRQPLQPTAVDLPQLVNGMAGLIGSTLGPNVDVRVDLARDLPPARADLNQLEMALLNLAVNARDAMPDGGVLTISATRESLGHGRSPRLKPGHYVRLAVSDTGVGMDEATLARAVEPFFSTKGIGKGTGLGLSMVHGLAAQLGGGLTIASEPGRGATVELWLPVSFEAPADGEDRPVRPEVQRRGLALLVDDEELVRMSTADMLNDLGYEVVEAGSAEEALRLFDAANPPDLLVTDHLMPGMSGVELVRELRLRLADLPALIVSGYAEVDGIAPDLPRLTKPFRNAELAQRLADLRPAAATG